MRERHTRSPRVGADAGGSSYPGGKGGAGVYHKILRLMPPHTLYVEPFLGGGAVMRNKRPAAVSVGADADRGVVERWRRRDRRRDGLIVVNADALQILASLVTLVDADTLVYADPPYLRETRTRMIYRHEFATPQQHASLLALLQELAARGAKVMVSGYASPLYTRMLAGWYLHTYTAMTRGGLREESLWCSFPPPTVLHDSRYAGGGYRERLRIKRKAARWRRRLASMDPLERQVVAEALADVSSSADRAGADAAASDRATVSGTTTPAVTLLERVTRQIERVA